MMAGERIVILIKAAVFMLDLKGTLYYTIRL